MNKSAAVFNLLVFIASGICYAADYKKSDMIIRCERKASVPGIEFVWDKAGEFCRAKKIKPSLKTKNSELRNLNNMSMPNNKVKFDFTIQTAEDLKNKFDRFSINKEITTELECNLSVSVDLVFQWSDKGYCVQLPRAEIFNNSDIQKNLITGPMSKAGVEAFIGNNRISNAFGSTSNSIAIPDKQTPSSLPKLAQPNPEVVNEVKTEVDPKKLDDNQKKEIVVNQTKEECSEFKRIGSEDELEKCLNTKTAHLDPEYVSLCETIITSNPDRYNVCVSNISSKNNSDIERSILCKEHKSLTAIDKASCLSNFSLPNDILSVINPSGMYTETREMNFNTEVEFKSAPKPSVDPDIGLLNKCTGSLRNNSYVSGNFSEGTFFRRNSNENENKSNPKPTGTYLRLDSKDYFFDDSKILMKVAEGCSTKLPCVLHAKVGNKIFNISINRKPPAPSSITFKLVNDQDQALIYKKRDDLLKALEFDKKILSEEEFNKLKIKINGDDLKILPELIGDEQKSISNSSLLRSISSEMYSEFVYLKYTLKNNGGSITPEAYAQTTNSLTACNELIGKMSPNDSEAINNAKNELDMIRSLYELNKQQNTTHSKDEKSTVTK